MKKENIVINLVIFTLMLLMANNVFAARIKDIASVGGVRANQLIGYGVVVGLSGTGDDLTKNLFTTESLINIMSRQGLSMKGTAATLKADNIASVMVTAALPPFAKIGTKIDVSVSSVGSAKSLLGGTLLLTPLRGVDGEVYAVAQGAVTLGGFSAGGAGGGASKNHTTAGGIANGAFVEKELHNDFDSRRSLVINLQRPDFTTASRMAAAINKTVSFVEAKQIDSFSVSVKASDAFAGSLSELVYFIESLDVPVDAAAVVMLNEKTGTVVMGDNVRISTVAIAHGNLSIQIKEDAKVSQPLPFAPAPPAGAAAPAPGPGGTVVAPGGQTVVIPQTTVNIAEEKKFLMMVPQGVTIYDVVRALNSLGVSPRDLITILQAIKAAGALQADLHII
ncbi:MAG: flagellar biosynthesis protein FlgA [Deltaproteobacteria bacterium HGW-Deltaproteobacteria-10]|nr:MAG: flagellar biosynthesis protein FlgA [Deltaproteobacteria bacterium HGW-Deltaproteobacteria-10]